MGSVEVAGEEHLLAAANSTDTKVEEVSAEARLLGQMVPSASSLSCSSWPRQPCPLQRLPQLSVDVTQTSDPALANQLQLSLLALASGFSAVLFCSCDRKGFPSLIRSLQGSFGLILSFL